MYEVSRVSTVPIASIVEDDSSVRLAHSSLLRSIGWRVRLYESAESFLESGHLADVACVICDVRMPGLSGLQMQCRLLEKGHALPVIFVTAFPSDAMRRQALTQGALCLLAKPVDNTEIKQCLDSIWKAS
jgi:FixJ family two-component response regulator